MNGFELVSVIITSYNYEHFISFAIESALNQKYGNVEILIIDDGSTDGSRKIIEKYSSEKKIRIFFQKNSGQAAATNRGIMEASGKYIAFLDADDIWYPEKLEKQVPLFEDSEVGVVYSASNVIDAENKILNLRQTKIISRNENFTQCMLLENFIPFSSSVVKRECFYKSGLLNSQYRVCTDYDLWLRISKFYKSDCVNEPLIGYRVKQNSLSSNPVNMLNTSREITELFYQQNAEILDDEFIKKERLHSLARRVYIFSRHRYRKNALSCLFQLFILSPFGATFNKSFALFIYNSIRPLLRKGN